MLLVPEAAGGTHGLGRFYSLGRSYSLGSACGRSNPKDIGVQALLGCDVESTPQLQGGLASGGATGEVAQRLKTVCKWTQPDARMQKNLRRHIPCLMGMMPDVPSGPEILEHEHSMPLPKPLVSNGILPANRLSPEHAAQCDWSQAESRACCAA